MCIQYVFAGLLMHYLYRLLNAMRYNYFIESVLHSDSISSNLFLCTYLYICNDLCGSVCVCSKALVSIIFFTWNEWVYNREEYLFSIQFRHIHLPLTSPSLILLFHHSFLCAFNSCTNQQKPNYYRLNADSTRNIFFSSNFVSLNESVCWQ